MTRFLLLFLVLVGPLFGPGFAGAVSPENLGTEPAADAIPTFQAVSLAQFNSSWQISLDIHNRSAGEVLRTLAAKLHLSYFAPLTVRQALLKPISLHLSNGSVPEAIETICRQAGVHPSYNQQALMLDSGTRTLPAVVLGPFIVDVSGIDRFVPQAVGALHLELYALGLPKPVETFVNSGASRDIDWKVDTIRGPHGEDLLDSGLTWSSQGSVESAAVVNRSLDEPLKNLLRSVTSISSVRGVISLPIPVRVAKLHFPALKPGAVQKDGDIQATIHECKGGSQPEVSLDLAGPSGCTIRIEAAGSGGPIEPFVSSGSFAAGNLALTFRQPIQSLVAVVVQSKMVRYPFNLRAIPLRQSPLAPRNLPALHYPGYPAPVSMQFLGFRPHRNTQNLRFKVINHSNKAVRRVEMELDYRDGQGKVLDTVPESQDGADLRGNGGPPVLAPVGGTVTFETSWFEHPGTVSVVPRITSVSFTDATEWKPKLSWDAASTGN